MAAFGSDFAVASQPSWVVSSPPARGAIRLSVYRWRPSADMLAFGPEFWITQTAVEIGVWVRRQRCRHAPVCLPTLRRTIHSSEIEHHRKAQPPAILR